MAPPPSFMSTRRLKAYKKAHGFFRIWRSSKAHEPSPSPSRLPPPSNSLLGLPAEIKQLIFEQLPDILSLRALISTCSTLRCVFLKSESSILAEVLQRQIPSSLMYPALAILKSSEPTPWSRQTAEDLITLYTNTDKSSLLRELSLRNAIRFSEMHDHVHFFANRFATYALSQHPVAGIPGLTPVPTSPNELSRIERTFYRFQLYCNLIAWRKQGLSNRCTISSVISGGFAPWENEQLACVIDYLANTAFRDIPWHIMKREIHIPRFRNDLSILDPAKYIPLGLAFLHRLALARTPKEIRRLLSAQSLIDDRFFYNWSGPLRSHHYPPLSEMNEEEQQKWINTPTACDGDGGAEAAWRWAYADHGRLSWYKSSACRHLREWGYVMWDYDRLDSCDVFDMDRRSLERSANQARLMDAMVPSVLGTNANTLI